MFHNDITSGISILFDDAFQGRIPRYKHTFSLSCPKRPRTKTCIPNYIEFKILSENERGLMLFTRLNEGSHEVFFELILHYCRCSVDDEM